MLIVANRDRYAKHRAARDSQPFPAVLYNELMLPAFVFGSIGAIAWAIRGTNGWGGMDGTIVPGMMWGILWYYVCWRKGFACHGVALWLGLGIALGGELGYGQYVSWIRGQFQVGDEIIDIAPWHGWAWFFLCGIGWGAPGGVMLGWALSAKSSLPVWIGRLTIPVGIAYLGWLSVQWYPTHFFPNYGLGIYADGLDRHLDRTVYTNTQNFTVVMWWVGVLLVAAVQRDKTSLVICAIIGGGFGPGFMTAAIWCLGYEYAPQYIDWWKVWELHAGFNLGLLYVLALYWCVRHMDKTHDKNGVPLGGNIEHVFSTRTWCMRNLLEMLAVFLMVLVLYLDGEAQTSIFMGLVYVAFMGWLTVQAAQGIEPKLRSELRGRVSLIFSVFVFLFVTLHGATSTMGLVLELYPPESVEQYSWPLKRILLFLPMVVVVVGATLYHMIRTLWPPRQPPREYSTTGLADWITNLMTGLAAVGAVSIWPSEIGILYAVFLCVAVWAFNRMNRRNDAIDTSRQLSG